MSFYPQVPVAQTVAVDAYGRPMGAVVADPYAAPGGTVLVASPVMPMRRSWASGVIDPCGGPDGCNTCCYVTFCGPCAAGDVAQAAGRSYFCSCFVVPCLLPCCAPGVYAQDREALAGKYQIDDQIGCLMACLMFWAGCGGCLLCQEVAFLKANGYYDGVVSTGYTLAPTTAVVMAPGQQTMYVAPPGTIAVYNS